jgi:hypothetical protein
VIDTSAYTDSLPFFPLEALGEYSINIDCFGVCFAFHSDCRQVLQRMIGLLTPGWRAGDFAKVSRRYSLIVDLTEQRQRLLVDSRQLAENVDLDYLLDRLETDLQIHLGDNVADRVFIHAGVVGYGNRAVVIPGRSMSGKSSMVAAFLRAGASYYSDEFAICDGEGMIHPYPRLLSLRQAAGRPRRVAPESLGAVYGHEPLRNSLILLTRYRPGFRWRPQTATPGQTVLELMKHCVAARRRPQAILAVLQQLVSNAVALRGSRGEAEELVDEVLRILRSGAAQVVLAA